MHTPIEIRWPNVTVTSLYADRRRPLLVPEAPRYVSPHGHMYEPLTAHTHSTLDIADGQLPCAVIIIRAPAAVVAGFDFDIGTCVNTVVQIFVLQVREPGGGALILNPRCAARAIRSRTFGATRRRW
jgi:hypothetical protein